MSNANRCHACGGALGKGSLEHSMVVAGHRFVAALPSVRCTQCGQESVSDAALEQFELRVSELLLESGTHAPEALVWFRRSIGLRATELADLLGVTPETVSRWENGKVAPPNTAIVVMGKLAVTRGPKREELIALLRSSAAPRPLAKTVRLSA
ncbi:MAG: type II toxin-antitoxin system MqsA family antitoxin [Myxococcales bacterium]|nr:type II toxin-antitoxin system MqsA family antitoxin [Myxococcales bacterium]